MPIEKGSSWKIALNSVSSDWKTILYDDDTWEEMSSAMVSTGTQYFRKHFAGMSSLAAYELRVNYQYGVIFYINGLEVYRDNMPSGDVSFATPASSSYESLAYRGVIRSASEVTSVVNVLAIELHLPSTVSQANVTFDAWLAIYASTVLSSSDACFAVSFEPQSLEISTGTHGEYVLDYNKGSYWGVSALTSPEWLRMSYSNM